MIRSISSLTTLAVSMTLSTAFLSNIPPSYANTSCQAAVNSVKTQIQKQKNVQFVVATKDNSGYLDYPKNRSHEYIFVFQGKGAINILYSDKLMTALAAKVINHCETVGLVLFGYPQSDVSELIGLMHDGSIQVFKCTENQNSLTMKWGEIGCYH